MPTANVNKDLTYEQRISIIQGSVDGYRLLTKFGYADVGTTVQDMNFGATAGSASFEFTSASPVRVRSSSASDASGGSGARTLRLIGLDANYDEIQETVTLNGTSNVTTTASFFRLDRARVLTSGTTTSSNVGEITMEIGTIWAMLMPTQEGTSYKSGFTVPRNHAAYIVRRQLTSDSSKIITTELRVREFGVSPWRTVRRFIAGDGDFIENLMVPEKHDINIQSGVNSGSAEVGSIAEYYLINYGDNYSTVEPFLLSGGDSVLISS